MYSWDLDPVDGCYEGTLEIRARWVGYGPRWYSGDGYIRSAHVMGHASFNGVRYPAWGLSLGTGQLSIERPYASTP